MKPTVIVAAALLCGVSLAPSAFAQTKPPVRRFVAPRKVSFLSVLRELSQRTGVPVAAEIGYEAILQAPVAPPSAYPEPAIETARQLGATQYRRTPDAHLFNFSAAAPLPTLRFPYDYEYRTENAGKIADLLNSFTPEQMRDLAANNFSLPMSTLTEQQREMLKRELGTSTVNGTPLLDFPGATLKLDVRETMYLKPANGPMLSSEIASPPPSPPDAPATTGTTMPPQSGPVRATPTPPVLDTQAIAPPFANVAVRLPARVVPAYTLRELADALAQASQTGVYVDKREETRRVLIVGGPRGSDALWRVLHDLTGLVWRTVPDTNASSPVSRLSFLTRYPGDAIDKITKNKADKLRRDQDTFLRFSRLRPGATTLGANDYNYSHTIGEMSASEQARFLQYRASGTSNDAQTMNRLLGDPAQLRGAQVAFSTSLLIGVYLQNGGGSSRAYSPLR